MSRRRSLRWILPAIALQLLGCDWDQSALMNGVSVLPTPPEGHILKVYLALDGIAHAAMLKARERGAFSTFNLAKSIPMYPATSDASWTRILHTQKFAGYEFTYYDVAQDTVKNTGLGGFLAHGMPHAHGSQDFPYYDAFDVHGQDYLDGAQKYVAPETTYKLAMNQLFVMLAGRKATQRAFVAYVLELDVIGHYSDLDTVAGYLVDFSERLEAFRRRHSDVTFQFTILSDHGLDHIPKRKDGFVTPDGLASDVGIEPTTSVADAHARSLGIWAVAPQHTRVTYGTMNTATELIPEVALRISRSQYVDLVVARAAAPTPDGPIAVPPATQWVSLLLEGEELVRFGFDAVTDRYWLPKGGKYTRLDVQPRFAESTADGDYQAFTDEALFAASADSRYPDLFFRARSSLSPISIRNTADVIYSLRSDYALKGFSLPGADGAGAGGSHGAMARESSETVLLSEERELPAVVRSDNILGMFPALAERLSYLGVPFDPGDDNAWLDDSQR